MVRRGVRYLVAFCVLALACSRSGLNALQPEVGDSAACTRSVCSDGAPCCRGEVCLAGRCVSRCSEEGASCSGGSSCCSELCRDARCAAGASNCFRLGAACSNDAECCSRTCSGGQCGAPRCTPGEPPIELARTEAFPFRLALLENDLFYSHDGTDGLFVVPKFGGRPIEVHHESAAGLVLAESRTVFATMSGEVRSMNRATLKTELLARRETLMVREVAATNNKVFWNSLVPGSVNHYDVFQLDLASFSIRKVIDDVVESLTASSDGFVYARRHDTREVIELNTSDLTLRNLGIRPSEEKLILTPRLSVSGGRLFGCDDDGIYVVTRADLSVQHIRARPCYDVFVTGNRIYATTHFMVAPGEPLVSAFELPSGKPIGSVALTTGDWQPSSVVADETCLYVSLHGLRGGAVFRFPLP
jgi:hypothetical protein